MRNKSNGRLRNGHASNNSQKLQVYSNKYLLTGVIAGFRRNLAHLQDKSYKSLWCDLVQIGLTHAYISYMDGMHNVNFGPDGGLLQKIYMYRQKGTEKGPRAGVRFAGVFKPF